MAKKYKKKVANKKQKIITETKVLVVEKSYKEIMLPLEEKITKKIGEYIEQNKLKYTANSPEFIKGLQLGLQIGTEQMYESIKDKPIDNYNPNQLDFFEVIRPI